MKMNFESFFTLSDRGGFMMQLLPQIHTGVAAVRLLPHPSHHQRYSACYSPDKSMLTSLI